MMKIDLNNPFQASWNQSNAHLNPNQDGIFWALIQKVKNFVLYIPNTLVASCINPRSETKFYPSQKFNENDGDFRKEIITPDHVHLAAKVHVAKGAHSATPTAIFFNPLGASASVHRPLSERLIERGCNVVLFEPRGLGSTWRAEDLVVDGDSIYQYVTQELGIEESKVNFYGYSLGGVIGIQAAALHPESGGKYVGDRPFCSLFAFITENCCIESLGWVVKKVTSFVSAVFLAYPLYLLGWEWDSAQACAKLQGKKLVIYHPHDCLFPFEASLASRCSNEEVLSLDANVTGFASHFSSIAQHHVQGRNAADIVADFLAEADQPNIR
jgi:pimeloyl-ACP methyl ester carboxylesterase